MAKKRIIWLKAGNFNGYATDGGTRSALTLLKQLHRYGADTKVEVIAGNNISQHSYIRTIYNWTGDKEIKITKNSISFRILEVPVTVHFVPIDIHSLYFKKEVALFIRLTGFISNLLNEIKPDIVITSQEDVFSLSAATAGRSQIPFIFHIFSSIDFLYQKPYLLYHKELRANLKLARVLARDEYIHKHLKQRYGIHADILPPIIDYKKIHITTHKPYFITCTDFALHKGAVLFSSVARKLPDLPFLLIDYRGLFRPVSWLSHVTVVSRQSEMNKIYKRTKVLFVPTLWPQSSQRSILEAMSNGIPVVATKLPGITELIGDSGFLVPINKRASKKSDFFTNLIYHTHTYLQMAAILRKLMSNDAEYTKAQERARRRSIKIRAVHQQKIDAFFKQCGI